MSRGGLGKRFRQDIFDDLAALEELEVVIRHHCQADLPLWVAPDREAFEVVVLP